MEKARWLKAAWLRRNTDMATTPKLSKKQQAKVGKVMHEFKTGTLHSGKGGKVVKNPKQGIAIALSEASKLKKK